MTKEQSKRLLGLGVPAESAIKCNTIDFSKLEG